MSIFANIKYGVIEKPRQKLVHLYSPCEPESNVLDVGISNIEPYAQANMRFNNLRFGANKYTGLSIGRMNEIRVKYPNKCLVGNTGNVIIFRDNEHSWVCSSVAIGHVGGRDDQVAFLCEMMRVSKKVFFTKPNKILPVEGHANAQSRRRNSRTFYSRCAAYNLCWARSNLPLLNFNGFENLTKKSMASGLKISRNRFLGLSMNFTTV